MKRDAPEKPRTVDVGEAVALLRAGGLVALPTETVYGLGADALDRRAVRRIFEVKGRPEHHPLIVHLADADRLPGWAEVPAAAWRLAERFWPGPLTIILPRGPLALDEVTGGLETIGVRVPAHPLTHAVLDLLGSGVAAPSANRFGHVSPTSAAHVVADLGADVDGILDGGPCAVGIESTIVDLAGDVPAILRLGAITPSEVEAVVGPVAMRLVAEHAQAPGQLASHYAPRARLELVPRAELDARAAALSHLEVRRLGDRDLGADPASWAKNLYAALRDADATAPDVILVPTPPPGALAAAVHDRLTRASAPRPHSPRSGRHAMSELDALRTLAGDLLCAEQALRKKVAAALHDEIAQMLAAARMKVALAKLDAPPKTGTDLDAVVHVLDETMDAIRRLTRELAPPPPPDLAVLAALRWLQKDVERRLGAAMSLVCPADGPLETRPLDPRIATSCYACLGDLVAAVHRHGAIAELAIETDGTTFIARVAIAPPSDLSFDLDGARERLRMLGGGLERDSGAIIIRAPLA